MGLSQVLCIYINGCAARSSYGTPNSGNRDCSDSFTGFWDPTPHSGSLCSALIHRRCSVLLQQVLFSSSYDLCFGEQQISETSRKMAAEKYAMTSKRGTFSVEKQQLQDLQLNPWDISHFSVVVMKHHGQSNLQEEEFTVLGLQFWGRWAHCDGEAWW